MQKNYYVLCMLALSTAHYCANVFAAPFLYAVNEGSNSMSVIDTATNTVTATIPNVAPNPPAGPLGLFITRDGKKGFVTDPNAFGGAGTTITPVDLVTNTVSGAPITTGSVPLLMAMPNTCKSTTAYLTHLQSNYVAPVDVVTNALGSNIALPGGSTGIVLTRDDKTAYVCLTTSGTVMRIDTATNTLIGDPIPVGPSPAFIILSPDGKTLYVGLYNIGQIVTIDVATNTVVGDPITVQTQIEQFAITPDGRYIYASSVNTNIVSVVDTTKRQTILSIPFPTTTIFGVAISDTGKTAYVSLPTANAVYPIDVATNTVGAPIITEADPALLTFSPLFLATGTVRNNIFLDHTECVFVITWTESPSDPKLYRIYRDGIAIGNVPATQPRQFFVPLQGNTESVFTITAVAQDGSESRPMLVC